MKADQLRAMGVLNLLFQLVAMTVILSPVGSYGLAQISQQTSNRISVVFFTAIGIAIGLLGLRKWAVLYFCLGSVSGAIWLFLESIWFVSFPFSLCYLTLAIVFVLPTVIFTRSWSLLSWGGKWFF